MTKKNDLTHIDVVGSTPSPQLIAKVAAWKASKPHSFDLEDGWCHSHRTFCSMIVEE